MADCSTHLTPFGLGSLFSEEKSKARKTRRQCHPKTGRELPTQTSSQPERTYMGTTENTDLAEEAENNHLNASTGHTASA